jgi:hypothetical protein
MRVAVIGPVKNEAQFIGYSIMAAWPYVEEFVYAVAPSSDDGTIDILRHIAKKYGKVRLLCQSKYDFDPHDMKAYNESFNDCIQQTRCDAAWFLHPDMIVTNPQRISDLKEGPLAWVVNMTSFARDMNTVITKGRADKWKNVHANKFGLHYYGGYGSVNEDFYHSEITGKSYRHFGTDFKRYPFEVIDSGINVNHYCELKPYNRRFEKMKLCLKTQAPDWSDIAIEETASQHPRVTLEQSSQRFGTFEFEETTLPVPEVFAKYKSEFEPFQTQKELIHA